MSLKTCPYCQKQISTDAIKCPYCQEWLNKASLTWKNPYLISVLFFGLWGCFYLVGPKIITNKYLNSDVFKEPIKYTLNHKLQILNTRLIKEKASYRIIGEIQNNENFSWESIELLTVFNDKEGKPLYLSSSYVHDLKPGEKRPFQSLAPCRDEDISFENFKDFETKIETASARPWKK